MPHLSAMRSAPSNCEVISYCGKYDFGIGMPRPSSLRPLDPIGIRLMTSTPQATATSTTPLATRAVARLVACCEEPHWVSTVVLATDCGRPARQPRRAADVEGLLADLAHAAADDLADRGGVDARSARRPPSATAASRSAGWTVDRPPFRRPTGVRTASTITTSDMGGNLSGLRRAALPAGYRRRRPPAASSTSRRAAAPMKATKIDPRSSSSKVAIVVAGGEPRRPRPRTGRPGPRWRSCRGNPAWVRRRPVGPAHPR